MKKKVAVAMSGGLDSAVAASLLLEENYQVSGIHFSTGYEPVEPALSSNGLKPRLRAESIASSLGIPLEIIDCSRDFSQKVIHYFIETYSSGKTPNPCVICNRRIKFGVVLNHARRLGTEALVTGHYARISSTETNMFRLLKGMDTTKDQSYFLCRLTQEQLGQAMFPLGTLTKTKVREIASAMGFTAFTGEESQELCFVNDDSYREFLKAHGVQAGGPGPIVNKKGEVLGQHQGLHRHTIGQRRGIGVPGPEPYYVLRLDRAKNHLVVGTKPELTAKKMRVSDINWIGMDPPESPFPAETRIRYRHKEAPSTVVPIDEATAQIIFLEPQQAITPGQAAVFYDGERILGGGWIVQ